MIRALLQPPAQTARASAGLLVLRLFCGYGRGSRLADPAVLRL